MVGARRPKNERQQPQEVTTPQRLGSLLKAARDLMRKDKGLNGDLDRLPMPTWVGVLAQQLAKVEARGTLAIRRDILVRQHRLNERQGRAVGHLLAAGQIDIRSFESLCPAVSRRSLQRDLAGLEVQGLIWHEGETNQLIYKLEGEP